MSVLLDGQRIFTTAVKARGATAKARLRFVPGRAGERRLTVVFHGTQLLAKTTVTSTVRVR